LPIREAVCRQESDGFHAVFEGGEPPLLDVHFRMPSDSDSLEMKLRRLLKRKIGPGPCGVDPKSGAWGKRKFRAEPADRRRLYSGIPGGGGGVWPGGRAGFECRPAPAWSLDSAALAADGALEASVLAKVEELLNHLNQMREEEGRGIERELRQRMAQVQKAATAVEKQRQACNTSMSTS